MAHPGWYLKRLRVMSGPEILHRLRQAAIGLRLAAQHRRGVGGARPASTADAFAFCRGAEPRLPVPVLDADALRAAASDLLDGTLWVGSRRWRWDGSADCWHRAPDTGRTWPRGFFGRIPYLQGNPHGEVRQLWEPARLQQLVDLSGIAQTGDAVQALRAAQLAEAQLESFVAQNPPLDGPHYISAMECGLRILAACHALDLLRTRLSGPAAWQALMRLVTSHAPLIEHRLSLYSSTGNHTVAEAAGLAYAGLLFPELPRAARWRDRGLELLAGLAETQVLPDGGGAEQATGYHLFNLHLFALVATLLRHLGRAVPAPIGDAVARGTRFVEALDTGNGTLPDIGDWDGGHALSRFLRLPASGEAMGGPVQFPQSGYTVVPMASRVRLILDHGSLGMPPSFGHGHADALSLQLYANSAAVLVDPGTYTYTGDQVWRRYFRGTRAHNTVTVDGRDQAQQDGAFLWSKPLASRVIAAELGDPNRGRILAEHDGYRELGLRHLRGVAWARDAWIYVWDAVLGGGEHTLELHWHLGGPPTGLTASEIAIPVAGQTVTLRCTGGDLSLHSAAQAPLAGWRSPAYGVLEPGHTLRATYRGTMPHTFETLVRLGDDEPPADTVDKHRKWMQDLSR